jgi:hypothetical protein
MIWRIAAMKNIWKAIGLTGLLCVLFVMPAVAQIANGVDFTTTFPFYAGNTKLPAGTYTIVQSDLGQGIALIRDQKSVHTAFIDFQPTSSQQPMSKSEITFNKYGNTDFLSQIAIAGESTGMQIEPSKAEKKMAETTKPTAHTVTGKAK